MNGGTYVSAAATWTDAPDMTSTATLAKDGGAAETYTSGTAITEDGSYVLRLTTRKVSNGREVQQEISFTINSDSPMPVEIIISGHYRPSSDTYASASLSWTDPVGTTSTAMLKKDDEQPIPYVMDDLIFQEGDYVLTVTSTKLSSGLTATATQAFKVLVVARPPIVSGFANNGIYFAPVTMSWELHPETTMISNSLENVGKREITNNISNPSVLEEDGTYKFSVVVGKDGEEAPYGFRFFMTGIRGVEDGQAYESVTPTWVEPIGFGAGSGSEAVLSKNGEPAEPYWKGTTIDEPGEYELTVTWRVGPDISREQSVQFVIDSELPEPVEVTGVVNGGTYVSAAATWTDAPGMTSTATLAKDGGEAESYAKGTEIAEDGSYVLKLTTRKDSNGREVQQEFSFTIDSVPPMLASITIAGESRTVSGQRVHYTAAATWTDRAGTTSMAILQKGSEEPVPYTKDTIIDQDGDYILTVTTTKQSNGLTSTATREFKVDGGPQPPVITGFSDNAILFGPIEMSWTPPEGTIIEWVELRKSNEQIDPLSNPMPLDEAGEYEFSVGARKGDDIRTFEYRFIVAEIGGVEDGEVYANATPDWFEPQHFGAVEALLSNGGVPVESYVKGDTITEAGEYVLTVTWHIGEDISESKSVSFTIDPTIGGPILTGFSQNAVISVGDEIAWAPREGTQINRIQLDNKNTNTTYVTVPNPKTLDVAGEYVMSFRVNGDSQEWSYTYQFIVAEITDVEEGGVYSGGEFSKVKANWFVPKLFGEVEAELTKDGSPIPYSKGTTLKEIGNYVLTVTWRANAGTPVSKSIPFTIVPPPPAPALSGFSDNAILFGPAEIAWTPSEGTQINRIQLDHKNTNTTYVTVPNPRTIDVAGEYQLRFYVSQDGVDGEHRYNFMVVEISGVEEDGVYASATPEWYEPQFFGAVEAELTKDGSPIPYSMGEIIDDPGEYVLTVTWRTDAGNSESKSIRFTIIGVGPEAPTIVLEGESNGHPSDGIYKSVKATWTDAEGTTSTATLTRTWEDGEPPVTIPYESGTLIDEEGDYVLTVTTTKTSNGLTATKTVTFTVTTQVP